MKMDDQEFLEHHGILGMRWGVRRSKEQLRRARGELDSTETMSKEERHAKLLKTTKASTLYKYRKELSNKELQERLNRIDMEKRLKELSDKERKSSVAKVNKTIKKISKEVNDYYAIVNSPAAKAAKATIQKKVKQSK